MKLLIIDNYDSFTYNLVHYAEQFVDELYVYRNDEIQIDSVADYDAIIISPGPGIPKSAGISLDVVKKHGSTIPMLGICLGHEAKVSCRCDRKRRFGTSKMTCDLSC